MGASLIEMVVRYSLGKGKTETVEQELTRILDLAAKAHQRLLELVTEDSKAYLNMREAKKVGDDAYQKALVLAGNVPREVKALCEEALGLAEKISNLAAAVHHCSGPHPTNIGPNPSRLTTYSASPSIPSTHLLAHTVATEEHSDQKYYTPCQPAK